MSIVLTHGYFLKEDQKEQKIMRPYPPLGLLYVSAYLEKFKVEHEVFDSTFLGEEDFWSFIENEKPSLIAFYTNLMTKVKILKLIKKLRKKEGFENTAVLLGGPDVTYNYEAYIQHGADFIIIGEGEESTLQFIRELEGEKRFEKVNGLVYKNEQGEVIKNKAREKIRHIDELPMPNRSKISMAKYLKTWKKYHNNATLNISTQRGCPYTCEWCSTAVYGQSYRRRSPALVVDEVEFLLNNYPVDALWFVDDVFTVSHKWLAAFSIEMQKRKIKIPFECITRAERMTEEVILQLKTAGCFRVWIGAESGSQRILDLMKRQVDINKVAEMMQLTKKHGIETGTFIMVGYPTETREDIELTLEYLKEANPDLFTITVAYPIKGTGLYNQIKSDITVSPEWATSTDRQIDFKRTYPRKYYDYAVRRIVNELKLFKIQKGKKILSKKGVVHKVKALFAEYKMRQMER